MRKQSVSESTGNHSPQPSPKHHNLRHSSAKVEELEFGSTTNKRKVGNHDGQLLNKKRNQSGSGDDSHKAVNNYKYQATDLHSIRRNSSLNLEDGPVTRESRKANLNASFESKNRQDLLPDISHDWEIIVKSLQNVESNGEMINSETKESDPGSLLKSTNLKCTSNLNKFEMTDSDKENGLLKKKASEIIPALSSTTEKCKEGKHSTPIKEETPSKTGGLESQIDDVCGLWRRPTRSSYKAFEEIFDGNELDGFRRIDDSLDEKNSENMDNFEDESFAETTFKATTEKVFNKTPGRKRRRSSVDKNTPRRVTRNMQKEKFFSDELDFSDEEKSESDGDQFKSAEKTVFNADVNSSRISISDEKELDFIGFGSPVREVEEIDSDSPGSKKGKFSPVEVSLVDLEEEREIIEEEREIIEEEREIIEEEIEIIEEEREIIEEAKLEESVELIEETKDEFEALFEEEDENLFDFEGFSEIPIKGRCCVSCSLVLPSMDALRQHCKIGHRRIYSCLFDVGVCGQLKGSVAYGSHLIQNHKDIILYLISLMQIDVKHNKMAQWSLFEESCPICYVPLNQPGKALHEMIIHGIFPPSLFYLVHCNLEQNISLWWTGKNIAFSCHFCQYKSVGVHNSSIVTCSVFAFSNVLSNHLKNVHLLNVPMMQNMWLIIRLLITLPYPERQTLATLLSVAAASSQQSQYAACVFCEGATASYFKIDFFSPFGLCKKCESNIKIMQPCWFNCRLYFASKSNFLVEHLLQEHLSEIPSSWCPLCGKWAVNILSHVICCCKDSELSSVCKFCKNPLEKESPLKVSVHSFTHHLFPCPIPVCRRNSHLPLDQCTNEWLPTPMALLNHLFVHFPTWTGISLSEIRSLLLSSRGFQGLVLTNVNCRKLAGIWRSLTGHAYILAVEGDFELTESAPIIRKCFICKREWEDLVLPSNVFESTCKECEGGLEKWMNNEVLMHQCPVFTCMKELPSKSDLFQHLLIYHKLFQFQNKKKYNCCLSLTNNTFSVLVHNILCHDYTCLVCPARYDILSQIEAHCRQWHSPYNWSSILSFVRNNKKPKKWAPNYDVMRIWNNEKGIVAQYDPSINISNILDGETEPTIVTPSLHNQNFVDEKPVSDELNEVNPWCSSLCSVSMSPSKTPLPKSIDKDIQNAVSDVIRKLNECKEDPPSDTDSCHMLIPSVSVEEEYNSSQKGHVLTPKSNKRRSKVADLIKSKLADLMEDNSVNSDSSEVPLEIDSSPPSPSDCLEIKDDGKESLKPDSLTVTIPTNLPTLPKIQKISKSSKNVETVSNIQDSTVLQNDVSTTAHNFVKSVNMIVAETFQSMSKAFDAPLPEERIVKKVTKSSSSKKDSGKGLGENASFDEGAMAENILRDLEEKFISTCLECNIGIYLPDLGFHIKNAHPRKIVNCICGFKGELNAFLVHSFHMSHIPSEARPIQIGEKGSISMIVLEARPDLKTITYPCYKCNKPFKQEKSRQLHYNLCKLLKKFKCDICGEKFALENHLVKHKEWKHNPQTCSHCGKVFNSSSSLAQHVLHIHKKQLNHHCKQCNDSFNTLSQLKVHIRIHTGEEPHKCNLCETRFISKNLLRKHIAHNHKEDSSSNESESGSSPRKNKDNSLLSQTSSDSSSDDEGQMKKAVNGIKIRYPISLKENPLTESDLETSVSETEEIVFPKKTRTRNSAKDVKNTSASNTQRLTSNPPPITPPGPHESSSLVIPELREDMRERVRVTVGKVCNPCGKEFDTEAVKLLHLYLIHPGFTLSLGLNECCFCYHKFSSADDVCDHHLENHQRMKLSGGNFRCLCGLTFREDGAYYFHLYYAHKAQRALNIGGDIVCRVCEGRPRLNKIVDLVVHLSDRHTMFDHVRFNDSYMCNYCSKAFESWTVLSLHFFMVHNATKSQTLSYDCPYCEGASPWHSLEALQYHLDSVHRGRHNQSQPVPEHTKNIYTPAPVPASPTKILTVTKPARKRQKAKRKIIHAAEVDPEVLYCTCQCPYDEVSDMIGCDNPNCRFQWFHFECVGIMAAPEGNWYCPECASFAQQKEKEERKKRHVQDDLYEYYSSLKTEENTSAALPERRSSHRRSSSNSSSSGSSSSSSGGSSSSSSSSDSSSESDGN